SYDKNAICIQYSVNLSKAAGRVMQVLQHAPHRHNIEQAVTIGRLLQCACLDFKLISLASQSSRLRVDFHPVDVPACVVLHAAQEYAGSTANIQQAARPS